MRCYVFLVLLLAVMFIPESSLAVEVGKVAINGFISQGYLNSSGNNFFTDTEDGSFQFNESGLTLTTHLNSRLRLGAQILSRDLGNEGNNEVRLDWGVVDYRYRDWLGVQAGKIKLGIGLYNEGRDSDFLRPMVFLPQSVYDEKKRDQLVAASGGGIYGNIPMGTIGDVDYQAYYGQVSFPEDSGQARGVTALASRLAHQMNKGYVNDFEADNDYIYGGSLVYYPPLQGLRFGLSYMEGKSDFKIGLTKVDPVTGRPVTVEESAVGRLVDVVVASVEYSTPKWTVASEYTEYTADREVFGMDIKDGRSQGWYGLITYRLNDKVSLSGLYDVFYVDKDDRGGDSFVAQDQPDYYAWRKDFGLCLRYDVSYRWVVKVEWHDIDGAALGIPLYNPEGTSREWSYLAAKASFNF